MPSNDRGPSTGPTILKGKTILVVDDFAVNAELLSLFAAEAGAIALTASDGRECVGIVEKRHVDLILMDRNMPVMDGLEATKAIRALPDGSSIVIVGITGYSDGEEESACLRAGMDAVYEKLIINEATLIEIGNRFFGGDENTLQRGLAENGRLYRHESRQIPAPAVAGAMVMDYDKALHEFEDDAPLLKSLMKDFNGTILSKLALMRQALEKKDYGCVQRESHGIRGGAANLCAIPLSNAAQSLETACRSLAPHETIAALLDELSGAIVSFDAFVCKRS